MTFKLKQQHETKHIFLLEIKMCNIAAELFSEHFFKMQMVYKEWRVIKNPSHFKDTPTLENNFTNEHWDAV